MKIFKDQMSTRQFKIIKQFSNIFKLGVHAKYDICVFFKIPSRWISFGMKCMNWPVLKQSKLYNNEQSGIVRK